MNIGEIGAIVIFFLGVYGMVVHRNIMKSILSLSVMDTAVILFFLAGGGSGSTAAPIGTEIAAGAADPIPQALMITAIVIGVAVTAVALTMLIYIHNKYGTSNWEKAGKMRERP